MSSGHQRIKWRRNIAENFNWLSRVHERYRQTTDRQTDRRTDDDIANMNMSSRSLKIHTKSLLSMSLLVGCLLRNCSELNTGSSHAVASGVVSSEQCGIRFVLTRTALVIHAYACSLLMMCVCLCDGKLIETTTSNI